MKFYYGLSAALVGASIVVMQSSPIAVALSPSEVGKVAKEITVRIDSKNPGSGVIIAKEGNLYFVITAAHVVNSAKNKYTIVTPDGERCPLDYSTVKKLPEVDLAIVQFTSSKTYNIAKMGNSNDATEGTEAYVAGWSLPSAAIPSPVYRFTEGRITAKVPSPLDGYALVYSNNTVPGMSGGVVLNNKGELIGVHGRAETTLDPVSNDAPIRTGFSLGISLNPYNKLITEFIQANINLSAQTATLVEKRTKLYYIVVNGKQGAIDKTGKIVINPQFDEISDLSEGLARIKIGARWGVINKRGGIVIQPQFDEISDLSEGLAKIEIGARWGVIDKRGGIVIQPQFDEISDLSEGLAIVTNGNKYGVIDKRGGIIIQPQFDDIYNFSEGLAIVTNGNKYGVIDKRGGIIIQPQFDDIYNFSEGLAIVRVGDKYGVIDRTGKIIIQPQFDEISSYSGGVAKIRVGNKYGVMDRNGKIIITPQFDDINDGIYDDPFSAESYPDQIFTEGLARVQIKEKWGLIDRSGKIVIQPQFDDIRRFSKGLAVIQIKRGWGLIDRSGKIVIQPQFDYITNFIEGVMTGRNEGKYGVIDRTGKIVILPQQIEEVKGFSDGLAQVVIRGKYGFINKSGNIVIRPEFEDALPFSEGLAAVKIRGKWGFIDKNGKLIIKAQFVRSNATTEKENNDQYQLALDVTLLFFHNDIAQVLIGNSWGYINKKGKVIWKSLSGSEIIMRDETLANYCQIYSFCGG